MDIIIATHGEFAKGIVDSAKLILGENVDLKYISLKKNDNIDDFSKSFEELIKSCNSKPLVFVDMFGGSPFNVSLRFSKEYGYRVVTGVNLPMVIESALSKENITEEEYDRFVDDLVDKSKESIQKVIF